MAAPLSSATPKHPPKKIVLAYSGGLDTSVILHWLKATFGCEVVTLTVDIGQGEEVGQAHQKAMRTGASQAVVVDLRTEFVRDYVFPMLRAAAIYDGQYLLGTSIARPLIARALVDTAERVGADAIAHGATGKGNDQVRFEISAYALNPEVRVIAPWRIWDLKGRADCVAYAGRHGIPVSATPGKPYSLDRNLLHASFEGGILEDPWAEPPKEMFLLTRDPADAPPLGVVVEVEFERGDPVAVNGRRMAPAALLARLNGLGGEHGVGRVDMVENRFVGMKSRGVYETPGGTILHQARRAVESITLDREAMRLRDSLAVKYAELVYNGFWFSPERRALQALVDEVARCTTGVARLRLYRGNVITLGRKSPLSLYDAATVTFEADDVYNQADAEGFIRLNALRLRTAARKGRESEALVQTALSAPKPELAAAGPGPGGAPRRRVLFLSPDVGDLAVAGSDCDTYASVETWDDADQLAERSEAVGLALKPSLHAAELIPYPDQFFDLICASDPDLVARAAPELARTLAKAGEVLVRVDPGAATRVRLALSAFEVSEADGGNGRAVLIARHPAGSRSSGPALPGNGASQSGRPS